MQPSFDFNAFSWFLAGTWGVCVHTHHYKTPCMIACYYSCSGSEKGFELQVLNGVVFTPLGLSVHWGIIGFPRLKPENTGYQP